MVTMDTKCLIYFLTALNVSGKNMAKTVVLEKYFEEEKRMGISVFFGGRPTVEIAELSAEEAAALDRCINDVAALLRKVAPSIAADWERHRSVFHKFAAVAKGIFPESKPIQYPSQAGGIGVIPLIPQVIKYAATASATYPCYTNYATNSWEMSLTAGTAAYIFGDGTNFYKASPTTNQHALLVIMQNGLIEIGSSPKIVQQRIRTSAESKYGVFATNPLVEIPVEPNKTIYQHMTLGAIPVYHDFGIEWKVLPIKSGTSTLKLLGLAYFEHDLLSDTLYVS